MNQQRIYLDHAATTPVHPDVVAAMLPLWTEYYGNPSSAHAQGRAAANALDQARATVAQLLNASPDEIVFTGSGSESDNLALRGIMWAARSAGRGDHLITTAIEHKAVLDTARQLRDLFGFALTVLPVDAWGRIDLQELEDAIRPNTVLISVMAANNEIGTLQPVNAIGQIARRHGVLFHSDAVQAIAQQSWDMQQQPIDLLSIAPHKFYGPKGIGILYVRDGIKLIPALTGGAQENGRRPGTSNVAFAVGAAKALQIAQHDLPQLGPHYQALRDRLIGRLSDAFDGVCRLTGHPTERLLNHASFALRGVNANDLLMHLDVGGISAGSGSACATGDPRPSDVLLALGLDEEWAKGGLRFTVGRDNTMTDVDQAIGTLHKTVRNLNRLALYN
ncbi:MAG: cysteine desulfurase [Anaerolineae bacterium]|nr:cysteine desulfurase [Anaerolineae bacterium]